MGKAENIKRARRMKEERLRREASRGESPTTPPKDNFEGGLVGQVFSKKASANGMTVMSNPTPVKYSQLLIDFAEPITYIATTNDEIEAAYDLAMVTWNLAIQKKRDYAGYAKAWRNLENQFSNTPELLMVYTTMIARKESHFAEYDQYIIDFELKPSGRGGMAQLNVMFEPTREMLKSLRR